SLVSGPSIFGLSVWSFTGFSGLFPVAVAALYWRRSTAAGVLAAVATVSLLWLWFFSRAWGAPGYTVAGTGVMPVAVIVLASTLALIVVSWLTSPPPASAVAKFFPSRSPS
ncbi:MAG: sodium:solute symporter family protein, partial [Thermoanaerobaculia bacterium]|nr:sodium:solute symporter family protein [Thermoanaerobaculia bacterium]